MKFSKLKTNISVINFALLLFLSLFRHYTRVCTNAILCLLYRNTFFKMFVFLLAISFLLVSVLPFFTSASIAYAYSFSGDHWHAEKASLFYGNTLPDSMKTPTYYGQQKTWDEGSPSAFYFYYDSASSNGVWYGYIDDKYGILAYAWWDTVAAHKGRHIIDADFKYDSSESWHTSVSTPPPPDKVDAWSVAAHEFGHWLSLGHSTYSPDGYKPTMYPSIPYGQYFPRTLAQDDKNGIWYIYEIWH